MAFKHKYTIICDDFRREDNGKLMLIGMYVGTIVVPQLPFALPSLTFFNHLETDRPGNWSFKFTLQHLETGQKLVEGRGDADVQMPGNALAPIKLAPLQFNNFGAYNFIMELEGNAEPIVVPFDVQLSVNVTQQRRS